MKTTPVRAVAMVAGALVLCCAQHSAAKRQNTAATNKQLEKIQHACCIVETDSARGSGFLADSGGKKYIFTNRHVVWGAREVKFRSVNGKTIEWISLELPDEADLARFLIKEQDQVTCLQVSDTTPVIGDKISVYGNSGGLGAITRLDGKILGVGPDRIEVNAKIVQGNSGSPILNTNNEVIGVATYATPAGPRDWVTKGTRFVDVRRFGMRLRVNLEWKKVAWSDFVSESALLSKTLNYYKDVVTILACWEHYKGFENRALLQAFRERAPRDTPSIFLTADRTWNGPLNLVVARYKEYWGYRWRLTENSLSVNEAKKKLKEAFMIMPIIPSTALEKKWSIKSFESAAKSLIGDGKLLQDIVIKMLNDEENFWEKSLCEKPRTTRH